MNAFRDSFISFLKAQDRRHRAFEEGVYQLDDNEGFYCLDCGWHCLTAPMIGIDDGEFKNGEIVKCRECDSREVKCGSNKIEYYQRFGYEYSEFPKDIPKGKEKEYQI